MALRGNRLLAVAVILGSLPFAFPSLASATPGHATTDPVALALKLAERYWHAAPCGGRITVVSSRMEPAEVDVGSEPRGRVLMWTALDSCTITVLAHDWPSWPADDEQFQWFCDGITHELGHVLGISDDGQTDPTAITYPRIEPGSPNYNSVSECRHVMLWYGGHRA